ncbi:lysozyme [Pectobacterium versatile]|uniref:lysozyme n=1 Tax=Pectobacterium versatile TaxID=2488639 RepID=UPI001CC92586|nr:lysozyme [Pectobacterium versatile]
MENVPHKIGQPGLELIKTFEGLRLKKYQDVVGKWTIGYGHLLLPGEHFPEELSNDQAEDLLHEDLKCFERDINTIVTVPLNQNQFDALVSLAFNIGIENVRKSTLLKYLNQGNYTLAATEFSKWDHAGGKEIPGLAHRRKMERDLFVTA